MATSYEQKVLVWLHTMLIEHDPQIGPGQRRIVVEEVRLEAGESEEGASVVILFREVRRPQCLFGFLTLAREPSLSRAFQWQRNVWDDHEGEGPQVDADMIAARLREEVDPRNAQRAALLAQMTPLARSMLALFAKRAEILLPDGEMRAMKDVLMPTRFLSYNSLRILWELRGHHSRSLPAHCELCR